ncbi:unnamed protein product [Ectocarpus sp. 4 AP-2014]
MAGMVGASPHLPSVTAVSVDTLFLVVMMCSLVEVVAGFVIWKTSRVTRTEAALISQRQTLRTGVAKTNYTATFVENSKLKRLLLKAEKDLERIQSARDRRLKSVAKAVRAVRVCVYGSMVVLMWGRPLISFSPDYLWPSSFSHALSGGRAAGSVGALSIVAMFLFGLVPRLSPSA